MSKKMVNVLFRKKPYKILLYMQKNSPAYPQKISKNADVSYAHTYNLLRTMREAELIQGTKKEMCLTPKGQELADRIRIIKKLL